MQKQLGIGFLPYEIGDLVLFKDGGMLKITDIRMIQYIKNPRVEFEVQVIDRY